MCSYTPLEYLSKQIVRDSADLFLLSYAAMLSGLQRKKGEAAFSVIYIIPEIMHLLITLNFKDDLYLFYPNQMTNISCFIPRP